MFRVLIVYFIAFTVTFAAVSGIAVLIHVEHGWAAAALAQSLLLTRWSGSPRNAPNTSVELRQQ